jgi:hypothetical protein
MANKKSLWGILVIMLVFGLVLVACNDGSNGDDSTEEVDIWSDVTSLSQVDGTWKGSFSQTQTMQQFFEANGVPWTDQMSAALGDMKVTTSMADMTITINAEAKSRILKGNTTMTFSGENISTVWESIKPILSQQTPGATFDDTKYAVTIPADEKPATMTDAEISEMLKGLKINQTGKKIKMPAEAGMPETILTKQ